MHAENTLSVLYAHGIGLTFNAITKQPLLTMKVKHMHYPQDQLRHITFVHRIYVPQIMDVVSICALYACSSPSHNNCVSSQTAVVYLYEMEHSEKMISETINHSLEKSSHHHQAYGHLFGKLIKEQLISEEKFIEG